MLGPLVPSVLRNLVTIKGRDQTGCKGVVRKNQGVIRGREIEQLMRIINATLSNCEIRILKMETHAMVS